MRIPYFRIGTPSPEYRTIFPDRPAVFQPLIKIVLRDQGRKHRLLALIDSGSEFCLFPRDIADLLGINIRTGVRAEVMGIGGGEIQFFFHEIEMLLDRYHIRTKVGFAASGIGVSGILGHQGFFDQFIISFNYRHRFVELKKPGLLQHLAATLHP